MFPPPVPPQPYPQSPLPQPGKSKSSFVIAAVVLACLLVPLAGAVMLGVAMLAGLRPIARVNAKAPDRAELDEKQIPRLIEKHLPCRKRCRTTGVTIVTDAPLSVSVWSDEIPGRLLFYRIDPERGAELAFSQDWDDDFKPATIDYRTVDWAIARKLMDELESRAVRRTVHSVIVGPCEVDPSAERLRPARRGSADACVSGSVLTSRGDLTLKYDARTGKAR
jgi:hypothetical protein